MPLAPGTSLSSSDLLSVCPLRLEKPKGESNFFLTAIISLAESERLGEIIGRRAGPWEGRLQGPSRQSLGGGEMLQRWNLCYYFLCFAQTSLGRSLRWWMDVKESQDLPITEIKVVELCVVHCRMGMGRLCTLARVVSLGNTCHM